MKNVKQHVNSNERKDLNLETGWDGEYDHLVFQRLEKIEELLSHDEFSQLDSAIDKSIIASAHRASIRPRIDTSYQISWWRKLSLPLYISAGFVFTVLAYKSLWPEPLKLIQSGESSTIAVDISLEVDNSESSLSANTTEMESSTHRTESVLPPFTKSTEPNQITSAQPKLQSEAIQPGNAVTPSGSGAAQEVFTGNQLVKAKYPEKESWVRKIIEQMRDGQYAQAKNELRDFKQIYPDYPIEEQIKVLIQ
jgi:hypothetical protein